MSTQNMILIGGALALLWYVEKKNKASASVTNATAPDAGVTFTTTQSAQAATAYYYPGLWAK